MNREILKCDNDISPIEKKILKQILINGIDEYSADNIIFNIVNDHGWDKDGKKILVFRIKDKDTMYILDKDEFVKLNESFVINNDRLESKDNDLIMFPDGEDYPQPQQQPQPQTFWLFNLFNKTLTGLGDTITGVPR